MRDETRGCEKDEQIAVSQLDRGFCDMVTAQKQSAEY